MALGFQPLLETHTHTHMYILGSERSEEFLPPEQVPQEGFPHTLGTTELCHILLVSLPSSPVSFPFGFQIIKKIPVQPCQLSAVLSILSPIQLWFSVVLPVWYLSGTAGPLELLSKVALLTKPVFLEVYFFEKMLFASACISFVLFSSCLYHFMITSFQGYSDLSFLHQFLSLGQNKIYLNF